MREFFKTQKKIKRILLIDDEEALLFGFSRVLQAPSIEINTAQTLQDAQRLIKERIYDVVIADLRLSTSDNIEGYEILSYVKTLQPKCRIIVLTAYGGEETKEKVHNLGADYYFEKPISPKNIKEILDNLE